MRPSPTSGAGEAVVLGLSTGACVTAGACPEPPSVPVPLWANAIAPTLRTKKNTWADLFMLCTSASILGNLSRNFRNCLWLVVIPRPRSRHHPRLVHFHPQVV